MPGSIGRQPADAAQLQCSAGGGGGSPACGAPDLALHTSPLPAQVSKTISQMVMFIRQEADEKAAEIGVSAEEEFNITKLQASWVLGG